MSEQSSNTVLSDLTPYAFSLVATAVLRDAGILGADEEISGPSMYGNKVIKRVPGTKSRSEGGDGIMFDGASATEWLRRRLEGGAIGARQRVNVNKLVAQFHGGDEIADDEAAEASATAVTDDVDPDELEQALQASLDAVDDKTAEDAEEAE